jgi:metal-responsive CopG/Arc/MetJ family transcriptional regulator
MARVKKPLHIYIDADLLDRLDRWLREQRVQPSRTSAVETALQEFIDRQAKRACRGDLNWSASGGSMGPKGRK